MEAGFVTKLIDQSLAGGKDMLLAIYSDLEEGSYGVLLVILISISHLGSSEIPNSSAILIIDCKALSRSRSNRFPTTGRAI